LSLDVFLLPDRLCVFL